MQRMICLEVRGMKKRENGAKGVPSGETGEGRWKMEDAGSRKRSAFDVRRSVPKASLRDVRLSIQVAPRPSPPTNVSIKAAKAQNIQTSRY
jgi:hypothetical protein